MLVIRDETPRGMRQVRMINISDFERPDDPFMVRILQRGAKVAASGYASYWADRI